MYFASVKQEGEGGSTPRDQICQGAGLGFIGEIQTVLLAATPATPASLLTCARRVKAQRGQRRAWRQALPEKQSGMRQGRNRLCRGERWSWRRLSHHRQARYRHDRRTAASGTQCQAHHRTAAQDHQGGRLTSRQGRAHCQVHSSQW